MTGRVNHQPEAVSGLLQTYIAEELAYDRSQVALSNDAELIEQRILDSMSILRMVNFIEEQFGVIMDPSDMVLENFATINAITDFIVRKVESAP